MYYIEKVDKLCGINKIIKTVKIQENRIIIPANNIGELKEKQIIKLANKTDKILQKVHSKKIVLSKELYKLETYKNILYSSGYDITDGKWLFEAISYIIIDYIAKKKDIKKEETTLSVSVNNLTDYTLENIKIFAKNFKTLNIVTNHIDKFKNLIDKIYDEYGVIITVTNNKRKSLIKSKIILNIDFPKELLNKYNIFDEAIIVNINGNMKINKKRFNGLIINDYEIRINPQAIQSYTGNIENYYIKQLYEAEFYQNIPFYDFSKKIKADGLKICGLYGINGKIL